MEFGPLHQRILQLAVSGQLVEQLDSEPAVEQVGPAPKPEEVPFEIPAKWKWVQIGAVGQIIGGGTPSSKVLEYWENPEVAWITPADLVATQGAYISSGSRGISQLGLQKSSAKLVPTGTVIYASRATIGALAIATNECCTNQGCKSLIPYEAVITSKWAYYALIYATPAIKNLATGTTFAEISGKKLGSVWIPLPPIKEQDRITAQVDEMLGRLDQMEAAYSEFAGPMAEHFRNLMLDKAIKGLLVPQLDSEPEVEQLGPAPKPEEVAFELPSKWKWVQLNQLTFKITDGTHNPPPNSGEGVPVLSAKDIDEEGNLLFDNVKRWAPEEAWVTEYKKVLIEPEDVLLTIVGTIGRSAVVKSSERFILQRSVAIIKPNHNLIYSRYLRLSLTSPYVQHTLNQFAAGTAQKGVYLNKLKQIWLPVPPIEEQRRIVAKLEEVFEGVKQLGSLMEYA